MTIREILTVPDPRLRQACVNVDVVDDGIRQLLDDMLETMYDAPGIGLAAIQIGVAKRIVVVDVSKEENVRKPMFLINPEIVWTSEEKRIYEEGCLSVPEFFDEVERPDRCKVQFLDRDGKPQELECEGLLATCIQHEIDHLDGRLFIDHLSKLKRDRVVKKFTKQAKQAGKAYVAL